MTAVPSWLWLASVLLGVAIGMYFRIKRDEFKLLDFLGAISIAMVASYFYVLLTKCSSTAQHIVLGLWVTNSVATLIVWLRQNKASTTASPSTTKIEDVKKTSGRAKRGGSPRLFG